MDAFPNELPLDHLVVAVPDLDAGRSDISSRLGCPVLAGGRHPRWGTWNALVPLRGGAYLEIIAPHPDPPAMSERVFGLDRGLDGPTFMTWAVQARNRGRMDEAAAAALAAGVDLGEVLQGSRRTPTGALLEWELTDPYADRIGGLVPFAISWGRTPHPSTGGAAEVHVVEISLRHPWAERISRVMTAMGCGAGVSVTEAPAAELRVVLSGPGGELEVVGRPGSGVA